MLETHHGQISIQNGQLRIWDPVEGGQPALIVPSQSVLIFINESQIFQPTQVHSKSHIRVTFPNEIRPVCIYNIELTDDHLMGFLTIQIIEKGYQFKLVESAPKNQICVNSQPFETPLSQFPEIIEDIKLALQKKGIVFGISEKHIRYAMKNLGKKVCIAVGKPPRIRREILDYYFQNELPYHSIASLYDRNEVKIPSLQICRPGETLLRIIPEETLEEGIDIGGQFICPKISASHQIIYSPVSITYDESTHEYTTLIEGVPVFDGQNLSISIYKTFNSPLFHQKYLNKCNLIFNEAIQYSHIHSQHSIEVKKNVFNSTLLANELLILHSPLKQSTLQTGFASMDNLSLMPYIESLIQEIENMLNLYYELNATVPIVRAHPESLVLTNLLKTQFPNTLPILSQIKQLIGTLDHLELRKKLLLNTIIKNIENHYQKKSMTTRLICEWLESLENLYYDLFKPSKLAQDIFISSAEFSFIKSSRHLIISQFCHQCNLLVKGNLFITGQNGQFTSGQIHCLNQAFIRELGISSGNMECHVRLYKRGKLYAEVIHPGVKISIESQTYIFDKQQKNVLISYQEQEIKINSYNLPDISQVFIPTLD